MVFVSPNLTRPDARTRTRPRLPIREAEVHRRPGCRRAIGGAASAADRLGSEVGADATEHRGCRPSELCDRSRDGRRAASDRAGHRRRRPGGEVVEQERIGATASPRDECPRPASGLDVRGVAHTIGDRRANRKSNDECPAELPDRDRREVDIPGPDVVRGSRSVAAAGEALSAAEATVPPRAKAAQRRPTEAMTRPTRPPSCFVAALIALDRRQLAPWDRQRSPSLGLLFGHTRRRNR